MSDDEPVQPHRSRLLVSLLLGTAAEITLETIGEGAETLPVLTIEHGAIAVTIEPHGPSEGGPVSDCDLVRAVELADAAQEFVEILRKRFEEQRVAAGG